METSGSDLIKFWDYASSKGLMRRETAETMKSACKVVLSTVEPETWETLDVTQLDVDSIVQRFERLKMTELKPDSLRVYGQRLRNGISTFNDFLASPTTWSYPTAESRAAANGDGKKRTKSRKPTQSASEAPTASPAIGDAGETITYPYPIRPGLVISMTLPVDLTRAEATRLAAFVSSLAVEEQLALPQSATQTVPA
jgi:hypothetical protein